jgi:hypothetical protein
MAIGARHHAAAVLQGALDQWGESSVSTRVDASEVRLLWDVSYWDGPLDGVCLFRGERCWFECIDEPADEERVSRRFLIRRLTTEQLAVEEKQHELFREKVGTHCDYDENGRRAGEVKPHSTWHEFYDVYPPETSRSDYSRNEVLGQFER